MKIGVDMDMVLADVVPETLRYVADTYGQRIEVNDLEKYDYCHYWKCSKEEEVKRVYEFFASEYAGRVKPIQGSIEGIRKLRGKGHRLFVITGRNESIRAMTEEWLERYYPGMFEGVYFSHYYEKGHGKLKICDELGIDLVIEDAMHHAVECLTGARKIIILDYPWNRVELPDGVLRAKDWGEIVEMIK